MQRNMVAASSFCLFLLFSSSAFSDANQIALRPQNTLIPLAALSPQEQAAYRQHEQLPFVEEFSDGLNRTFFHVHYKNETGKPIDARPFVEQSTIILDGKTYSYDGPQPTLFIQAGEDCLFYITPDLYVPKVKRGVLADALRRWRWVSGISPGTHTLSLQFGGRHYGPVRYNQQGTGAWNAAHE